MNCTEWLEAHNQEELDALLDAHGEALRVRVVGEWHGELCVRGRELHSLDLSYARILGGVDAAGSRILGELRAYYTCTGDSGMVMDDARIGGDVTLHCARIGGSLRADRVRIGGDLHAPSLRVGGDVTLISTDTAGDVDATHARIGGSLYLRHMCARNVVLNGADVGAIVDLRYARLRGYLIHPDARVDIAELPTEMHGRPGWPLADGDGYVLWVDDRGYYYAGSSGPLTLAEALERWDHQDRRARLYRRALAARG
jgi:hypothetical protein